MKINTSTELRWFINELDLEDSYTKDFLYTIFADREKDLYFLDLEKRKVVQTSQTFSLDSDWVSHVEEIEFFELFVETQSMTTVLSFKTFEKLKKVEQFLKDNFKFLNKK